MLSERFHEIQLTFGSGCEALMFIFICQKWSIWVQHHLEYSDENSHQVKNKSRKSFGLLEFAPKDYFQCQTLLKALSPCPKRFLVLAGSGWRRTQKQIHQVWISCEGTIVLFYILMFSWNLEGLNFRNQFIFKCCVISCFYVSPVLSVGGFGGNPVGCLKGC